MTGGGKMKKMIVLAIASTLVLSATSPSLGAEEFKMEGKVTKINGNEVTISDGKGKGQTVESRTNELKVGDTVLLWIHGPDPALDLKLSPQDIEFLTKECHIDPADVNVIPKLYWPDADMYIKGRKCRLLEPFKQTREWLRKYTPPPAKPIMPPKGFSNDYLTDEESDYAGNINARLLMVGSMSITSHMKGTVTRITGNQTTITDNSGRQTTFEVSDPHIKLGEPVTVQVVIRVIKNRN